MRGIALGLFGVLYSFDVTPQPRPNSQSQRFVPATLLLSGGFGDPDIRRPKWAVAEHKSDSRLLLAKAQHRFAVAVRLELAARRLTEPQLEKRLGYTRGYLVRKLNGREALTIRDAIVVADLLGASVVAALAPSDA